MKFDYPYLGTQLPIRAVGHSITQQPLQMSTVAANTLRWGVTAALVCSTPGMAADHPCSGEGLGQQGWRGFDHHSQAFLAHDGGLSSVFKIGLVSPPQIRYLRMAVEIPR